MLGEIHRALKSRQGEPVNNAGIGINIGTIIEKNDTQKQILMLVSENQTITMAQLATAIGVAQRNIEANLAQLKNRIDLPDLSQEKLLLGNHQIAEQPFRNI